MRKLIHRIIFAIFSVILVSCAGTLSDEIRTEAIYADISIESNGIGASKAVVILRVGIASGNFIELSPNDSLLVLSSGHQKGLEEKRKMNNISYEVEFGSVDNGTEFIVSLERVKNLDAIGSKVILPDAFVIQYPTQDQIFAPNDQMQLRWFPANDKGKIFILATTSCSDVDGFPKSNPIKIELDDTGNATFSVSDLMGGIKLTAESSCSSQIDLIREHRGQVSPNYAGGQIIGKQIRSIDIFIVP